MYLNNSCSKVNYISSITAKDIMNGKNSEISLFPTSVTVLPSALLNFDYYLVDRVEGPDPFNYDRSAPLVPIPIGLVFIFFLSFVSLDICTTSLH